MGVSLRIFTSEKTNKKFGDFGVAFWWEGEERDIAPRKKH